MKSIARKVKCILIIAGLCLLMACQTAEPFQPEAERPRSAESARPAEPSKLREVSKPAEVSEPDEDSKPVESSRSEAVTSRTAESIAPEGDLPKITFFLERLQNEDGEYILPCFSYGMTPQEALAAVEADPDLQPERRDQTADDGWERESYDLGLVLLNGEEFTLCLEFSKDRLYGCSLELEAADGRSLSGVYEDLEQQLDEIYGLDEEKKMGAAEEADGTRYDYHRLRLSRANSTTGLRLFCYENDTEGGSETAKISLELSDSSLFSQRLFPVK